ALPDGARPPRHHGREAERRAQDRQARLPRPARARTRRRLRRRSRLDGFPPTPEPAPPRLLLWNEPSASAFPTRQPARGHPARRDRYGRHPDVFTTAAGLAPPDDP